LRRGKPRWATEEVFYLWYDSVKALKFNGGRSMDNKSNKKKLVKKKNELKLQKKALWNFLMLIQLKSK
jgi:hypothetical protein